MKQTFALLMVLSSAAAFGQTGTVPSYLLEQVTGLEKNFVRLAEAIPEEKYVWRPADGVRSVSEVLLHVAGANYNLPAALGVAVPPGVDVRNLEKSTSEKAKVIALLKASYAHARQAVEKLTEADLAKPIKLFRRETQAREAMLVLSHHMHEHMGQLIAYARVNAIVPPWTADEIQRQRQAQPARPKQ